MKQTWIVLRVDKHCVKLTRCVKLPECDNDWLTKKIKERKDEQKGKKKSNKTIGNM